jgi:GNAT superfamily N-acetyltransferase
MSTSSNPIAASAISVHPLTPERQQDWLRFFDHDAFADHPEWAFCYCHCLHADTQIKKWTEHTAEENRRAVIPLIEQRRLQGLLAYAQGLVVGWCQAAPGRLIPALDDEPGATDEGVGNIVCFVVAAAWRRKGVARLLLEAACESLKRQGMSVAQAYPAREAATPGAMHYGPLQLYLDAGFEVWCDAQDDPSLTVRRRLQGPCNDGPRPRQVAGAGSAIAGSNLARCTLKKLFTLRTLASCVNRRCTSAW